MRELKFRGLSLYGRWEYGSVFVNNVTTRIIPFSAVIYDDNELSEFSEVNPQTVGQFTGLKDKNGKEIYEGDIIDSGETSGVVVIWKAPYGGFALAKGGWMFDHYFGEAIDHEKCEVIGNIHSNPELL